MHLRTIRLRGFKSFPDPVEVKLEPGVAVVVGPNGSGKSNVSDAIVWAAGSLTPSELRAEKPDDVLFGGGGDRAPADHCEVELVFDNEDGGFGSELDFSEIAITRRLVRGGEGQYLVNKAAVRRTDLVELLADVGLGGSMHSIVSQGKVDAVLASKPEDRRHLVEEAAGLGKFKRRKHRAELKLARVATQVERARDVEDEVRKRLRPLALQATAAERAEKLAIELGGLRERLARLDLADIAGRRGTAEERRAAAGLARRAAQEHLQRLLAQREEAEAELSDVAGGRERALGALYRLQGAGERLALRREATDALGARLEEDRRDAERAVAARTDETVRVLEDAARIAHGEARAAAAASAQAVERARYAHARLAAHERAEAATLEERLGAVRAQRSRLEAEFAESTGAQAGAGRTLVGLGRARERLAARRENAATLTTTLRAQHTEAAAIAARGGPSPGELEQAANDAKTLARAAATERDDIAERARAARDRLAALERALAEREGVAPAARELAQGGERLALASLDVEPGLERAVAAALAWRASAILARDVEQGLELVERARTNDLGPLAVVFGGRQARPQPPVTGARPLRDLVRGSDDALRLLDGVWLVDATALPSATHGTVITAEGHGYDVERGELWFTGETPEAVLLEMDARRRALSDEADELDARVAVAAAASDDAAASAGSAEAAYSAVAHLRKALVDVDLLQRLLGAAEGLERHLGSAVEIVTRLEAPVNARSSSGARRAEELGEELRRLASLEADAQRDASEAGRRRQAAEVVVARLGGSVEGVTADGERDALVVEATEALAAVDAAGATAREAADRASIADAALIERAPRRPGLDLDLVLRLGTAAAALRDGLTTAVTAAGRLEAPVRARADAGAQRAGELGSRLRELGAEEVELRRRADEAAERATAVEVELARLDAEAAEAQRRLDEALVALRESAGAAVGEGRGDSPLVDHEGRGASEGDGDSPLVREELAARIQRLDARREALGKVNPLAKEEYEAEKERLEELATQRQDLEDSLSELEKLRDELATTVQQRFDETFATVAANFEEVAATLFPGGEGRLRLVEPDEEGGEPGIEVELRPAGKRITRLTLLSGGEKALGAISFLFALFLAKPCPFYLLDEVEAALDDANIARFVELLRRYADRAQFIVITHQKRTMEAADVLYGVTMGGDGISQIVSRRLPRETSAVAATA